MNNEISSDLTKHISSKYAHAKSKGAHAKTAQNPDDYCENNFEASQDYLNALGRTKVNMDRPSLESRINSSLNILKADPEFVQNHVDFCDFLQEHGYSLEEAIIGADIILDKLRKEETYRS